MKESSAKTKKAPRIQLNMRVTPEMREDIEKAARESGRSISGELEHRFETYNFLKNAYGVATTTPELQRFMMALAQLFFHLGDATEGVRVTTEYEGKTRELSEEEAYLVICLSATQGFLDEWQQNVLKIEGKATVHDFLPLSYGRAVAYQFNPKRQAERHRHMEGVFAEFANDKHATPEEKQHYKKMAAGERAMAERLESQFGD